MVIARDGKPAAVIVVAAGATPSQKHAAAYSGLMIRFFNSAADVLAKFTHMPIHTLAYHYTRKPPLHLRPRDDVIVHLPAARSAVDSDPVLRKRVRAEQFAVLYAVVLSWQRCRIRAATQRAAWPWHTSLARAIDDLKMRGGEQGVDVSSTS